MSKYRNAYLDSALSVVKGSICYVTKLQVGRTTKSVKFVKHNEASITVGPFSEPLSPTDIDEIGNCVKQKILEDATFLVLVVPRSDAERFYGDMFLDEFGVPSNITELRIVILDGWNINCNRFPVLRSTGLLKDIELLKFNFKKEKQVVEVTFRVNVDKQLLENPVDLASDVKIVRPSDLIRFSLDGTGSSSDSKDAFLSPDANGELVTPWTVETTENKGIDYERLIRRFGCSRLTERLVARIERLTQRRAHHLLRRGFFFSHRDLDKLLDSFENNHPFYLYTGRGPSNESLHIGHLIPFMFTKYLQDAFNVPLIVHLSDDEKFLFKDTMSLKTVNRLALENIKDIIALGFDPHKTLIVRSTEYIGYMYPTVLEIQKKVTYNQMRGIFGFQDQDNVGKLFYPAVQAALGFSAALPSIFGKDRRDVWCLIPQAIDQDPYFRMSRDVAPRLGYLKPALVHSKFIPALQGLQSKMCGSIGASSVYCTDTPQEIKAKINKYAFTGGRSTAQEQREKGANLEVDVPIQYLTCFLEDDAYLEQIKSDYQLGQLLSGEVKNILIDVLTKIVLEHQKRRSEVTDDVIKQFMDVERESFKSFRRPA